MPVLQQDDPSLVFDLTGQQRRELGRGTLGVFGIVALVAPWSLTHILAAAGLPLTVTIGPGIILALVAALLAWHTHSGTTVVGTEGLAIRRGFLPWKEIRWSEVASMDTCKVGRGSLTVLKVTTDGGRTFRLPPLQDRHWRTGPDPDFYDKCEQLVDHWERHAPAAV